MANGAHTPGGQGRPGFGRVVARAVANPLNLGVAGAGAVAAWLVGAWPLAALGGAAYVAMVAMDLTSPTFWRRAMGSGAAAPAAQPMGVTPRALDPAALSDPAVRDAAGLVRRAEDELRRVLSDAQGDVAVQVATLQGSVEELTRRADRLARSGEEISRHLAREDPSALRREIERLEGRAGSAPDDAARRQWSEAAAARRDHLQVLADLGAAQERILASLSRIAAALDGLSAKVVRMAALDAQALSDLSGDMNSELARINSEVNAFEETLQPLVAAGVPA
jgi:hypothetical protein